MHMKRPGYHGDTASKGELDARERHQYYPVGQEGSLVHRKLMDSKFSLQRGKGDWIPKQEGACDGATAGSEEKDLKILREKKS